MKEVKEIYGLKYAPDALSNLSSAKKWADKCEKLMIIVLGDNNKFWVVCPADAKKLQQNGYELVK